MSLALYELAAQYRDVAKTLADMDIDEQTVLDTLESVSGELEAKAEAVAMFSRNLEVAAEAIVANADAQKARAKALMQRAASMRDYLSRNLLAAGIEKISGPGIAISFRKSTAVVIDEPGLIPAEFMATPLPPPSAPSKALIGAAIKAGREVPGAHVEVRKNIQIA